MKRKKSVGKHKWTRTDGFLGATAVIGGIIIGFMLNKASVPLEGDYKSYSLVWQKMATDFGFANNDALYGVGDIRVNEAEDRLLFVAPTWQRAVTVKLSDGTLLSSVVGTSIYPEDTFTWQQSISRYMLFEVGTQNVSTPMLQIYKDTKLLQTIDLAVVTNMPLKDGVAVLGLAISPNGKYILINIEANLVGFGPSFYVLFKGNE